MTRINAILVTAYVLALAVLLLDVFVWRTT